MGPLGHVLFGYILYSALIRVRGMTPRNGPTLALVLGTQFPDLVDKPLAWTFGVLPNGRSLAHSLITAILLLATLRFVLRRYGLAPLSSAFGVGYLSHLVGDAFASAAVGGHHYYRFGFLAWPLVPAIDEGERNLLVQLSSVDLLALSGVEVGFVALVVCLWLVDGTPGLRPILGTPRRLYRWLSANR